MDGQTTETNELTERYQRLKSNVHHIYGQILNELRDVDRHLKHRRVASNHLNSRELADIALRLGFPLTRVYASTNIGGSLSSLGVLLDGFSVVVVAIDIRRVEWAWLSPTNNIDNDPRCHRASPSVNWCVFSGDERRLTTLNLSRRAGWSAPSFATSTACKEGND